MLHLTCEPCRSPKLDREEVIDLLTTWQEQSSIMLAFLLGLFRLVWLFGKDNRSVVLENLALRQQISIYTGSSCR
jgi:hypothetical protein